jgi:hypothetical protein
MMEHFKSGDKVKYTGSIEEQVRWGNNDNPCGHFNSRRHVYYVERVEIHHLAHKTISSWCLW